MEGRREVCHHSASTSNWLLHLLAWTHACSGVTMCPSTHALVNTTYWAIGPVVMLHIFELMKHMTCIDTVLKQCISWSHICLCMWSLSLWVMHDPCPLTSLFCSSRFLPRKTLVAMIPKAHTSTEDETVADVYAWSGGCDIIKLHSNWGYHRTPKGTIHHQGNRTKNWQQKAMWVRDTVNSLK